MKEICNSLDITAPSGGVGPPCASICGVVPQAGWVLLQDSETSRLKEIPHGLADATKIMKEKCNSLDITAPSGGGSPLCFHLQRRPAVGPRCASICSVVRRWVLVVRSICILLPWCAPYAAASIAVDYQPFKIITHKYSLSSYNFPALYQLKFSSARPTGLNGHLTIRDSTPTSCQKGSY